MVAEAWDAWRAEVDFATRFVAGAPSLDITGDDPLNQHGSGGGPMSLREVLVGMIWEYARHMGHADLLRERIDGRIGQLMIMVRDQQPGCDDTGGEHNGSDGDERPAKHWRGTASATPRLVRDRPSVISG